MATRVGALTGANRGAARPTSAKGRFVTWAGVRAPQGLPGTWYKLAAYDAGGVRRHWLSHDVVMTDAPTAGVTLPYDTATLTIEGRVTS